MTAARPLRFLALALGLWIGTRAVMLTWPEASAAGERVVASRPADIALRASAPAPAGAPQPPSRIDPVAPPLKPAASALIRSEPIAVVAPAMLRAVAVQSAAPTQPQVAPAVRSVLPPALAAGFAPPRPGRWSGSAWLLLRDDRGGAALALGGSQAGARLLYRLREGLALSGRAYLPLRRRAGAELAAGIDWQPSPGLPLRLLAERRQDIGGEGRSAFALTAYGGLERRLPRGLRAEAYAQAGVVGLRSRDLFVDAVARVGVSLGPIELGGGAWAAAQPGASRIDAGPSVSWRLPVRGPALRVQADWRFRVAGDAAPGSGPALTLAADF